MKKIKYYIYLIILMLTPLIVKANDYRVDSYDFIVEVSKDRNYKCEENINVIFDEKEVLITKEIPTTIKDLKVDTNYMVETRNTKLIKINTKNKTKENYTFTYNYKDSKYDKDIYEININNNFNNKLSNVSFYITIPEDLNKNNVVFYLNDKKLKDVEYKINERTIIGTIKELDREDTLTVKVDYSKIYLNTTTAIATIVPIVLTIVSGLLWYIFGKDVKYKASKSYELPKNLNPLDIALIQNGIVKEKDLIPFILFFATKGYIKIIENTNNVFTIKKIKDYDGKNYKEALFFKALFRKDTTVSLTDFINIVSERKKDKTKNEMDKEIAGETLYRRFQRAKKAILPAVNDQEEKSKYYEKTSERKKAYLMLILATILILLTSVPFIEINKLYLLPISVIFSIITLYVLMNFVEHTEFRLTKKGLLTLTSLSILILVIMLLPAFRRNRIYLITFIVCCLCIAAILFFYKFMPKRTIHGTKMYGKVEDLKNFIWANNKNDFDIVISKEEDYFINLLPYSYILGIEEKVIKLLKEYDMKKPTWYELKDEFTVQKLTNSIDRLKQSLKTKNEDL